MAKSSIKEIAQAITEENRTETHGFKYYLRLFFRVARIVFFPLLLCYLELILHLVAYRNITVNFTWVVLFSFGLGSIVTFFTSVFSRKVNAILTYVFTFISTLIFCIELVYFNIFKGFAPISAVKMSGQAVTNFSGGMFEGIRNSIWQLLLLLIPFILLCALGIWLRPVFGRQSKKKQYSAIVCSAVILAGTIGIMSAFFSGTPSLYKTFSSSSTSTDTSVNHFGLNATIIQEIRWMIFPEEIKREVEPLSDVKHPDNTQTDPTVDFEALYDKAGENEELKSITAELSNMPATQKHEFTGICEGYNLISICAEAFCPEFIDPILTPTLYKLSTNGFVFNNFYSTFPNTTTNGEYSFCMGLYPDLSRSKTDSSFGLSATNYLPYTFGNIFSDMGKKAYAYHNYVAEFYYRNYTHTNMGYDFTAANNGLDIDITWPSSDYDMMVASVDDYINSGEQFCAYYMTFSGHYQYTKENAMSAKNWDKVEALPFSDPVKAYIACNLELEYALAYLMEQLEAAGVADKTVIVLTTDHFPYGLSDSQYEELSGRKMTDIFEKQKNSFICYVPSLAEPVIVDKYCSTVDILPTVLNLFGFTYDSRLLAGHDILAPDSLNVAVIADGSFITEGIKYNSTLLRYQFEDSSTEMKEKAEQIYRLIEKRFRLSTDILNNDYYSFVYDRKSDSEEIDNLTAPYIDVGIMEQSSVYYVMKNGIMEPYSDTVFGVTRKCSIAEVVNYIYRVAMQPPVEAVTDPMPFSCINAYMSGVTWAYSAGILRDDGLLPYDLNKEIDLSQLALIITRMAEYSKIDITTDETVLETWISTLPGVNPEILRMALFCHDRNIITANADEDFIFRNLNTSATKNNVATAIYRLCSYYIMPE